MSCQITHTMSYYAVVERHEDPTWYEHFMNVITKYIDTNPRQVLIIMSIIIPFIIIALYLNTVEMYKRFMEEKNQKDAVNDEVIEKILDQVGDDEDSWPVMLVNEVILLKNMINETRQSYP